MSMIGLDIGATKMIGVLSREDGSAVHCVRSDTPATGNPDALIAAASGMVAALEKENPGARPEGVGVGIAGYVESARGLVLFSPNLGLERLSLDEILRGKTGLPVRVDNDVNCALLGESAFGAAKGANEAIAVFLGTGIGTAFLCAGRLLRGLRGVAAEAGHTTFVAGGRMCACGKRGCFEAYAGGHSLGKIIREAAQASPGAALATEGAQNLSDIRRLALRGDPASRRIWDEVILAMRVLVSNLLTIFDPKVVILGGKLIEAIPDLFHEIQDFALHQGMKGLLYSPLVTTAALGDRAVALGATRLFEEII